MDGSGVEDRRRVASIAAYDVLGPTPPPELLSVVRRAAQVCGVPRATINLITDVEQHQLATVGFEAAVCPREDSMCATILEEPGPVVVPDARLDDRFRENRFVRGEVETIRFYAAHRLVSRAGVTIGTLCVLDDVPHDLTADQVLALGTLAERIVDILELTLRTRELADSLERVETMRGELERSNERLASFAGQISHDLKTPLTSLALSLDMAREQVLDGEDRGEVLSMLDRAARGTDRMAALIDGVLRYALRGVLDPVEVDLSTLVREVVSDLGHELAGLEVQVGDLPVVTGDDAQLRAVFQNLLENAARFRATTRTPRVRVGARRLGEWWRLEVADNGRGVPPAHRARIFEPLAQVVPTTSGSGIGLATCRRIVEAHRGTIGLEPVPGGGTTFWFNLPTG